MLDRVSESGWTCDAPSPEVSGWWDIALLVRGSLPRLGPPTKPHHHRWPNRGDTHDAPRPMPTAGSARPDPGSRLTASGQRGRLSTRAIAHHRLRVQQPAQCVSRTLVNEMERPTLWAAPGWHLARSGGENTCPLQRVGIESVYTRGEQR